MKLHHAITDGMGIMILFATLQDKYAPTDLIQTTQVLGFCKEFFLYLLKPFSLMYAFMWFLLWSTDVNCVKTADF